jgi:hypothetical protein
MEPSGCVCRIYSYRVYINIIGGGAGGGGSGGGSALTNIACTCSVRSDRVY